MRWWMLWLLVAGCDGCKKDLDPFDPDEPDPEDTPPVESDETDVVDSVKPPCPAPEVEPNNTPDSFNLLPMERYGCGLFESPVDGDYWRFTNPEDGWLAVDADSYRIGSLARLSVALYDLTTGATVGMISWNGLPEVHLRYPATSGEKQLFLRQSVGVSGSAGQGPDYFYTLRASVTKPPLDWDVDEASNDSAAAPQLLLTAVGGRAVFGRPQTPSDQDWYRVDVPPGRHTVIFDVDAHEFGSAADTKLEIEREVGGDVDIEAGALGWEVDPYGAITNVGNETLLIKIVEDNGHDGEPFWYVLRVTVEDG